MTKRVESPHLLDIDAATVMRNGVRVLDDLSLRIREGENTAILGPNGSGKSSLLKVMTYVYHPLARADGSPVVRMFGEPFWDVFELRSHLGFVSAETHQEFVADSDITGLEAVVSGFFASHGLFRNHHVTPGMIAKGHAALDLVGADRLARKPMAQMSTGEARRVLIARALAPDPRALLLDEPTVGLDMVAAHHFLEMLRGVIRAGKTVILVTHHVSEILPEIKRVVLLRDGRIFRDGRKADVLTTLTLTDLFGVPVGVRRRAGYYAAEPDVEE